MVEAPCVFVGDKLVRRNLQAEEFMDCYNIEVEVQKFLALWWKKIGVKVPLDFTKAAPIKVLMGVGQQVLEELWGNPKVAAENDKVRQTSENEAADPVNSKTSPLYQVASSACDNTDLLDAKKEGGVGGVDVKATKSNNAQVQERQWDQ